MVKGGGGLVNSGLFSEMKVWRVWLSTVVCSQFGKYGGIWVVSRGLYPVRKVGASQQRCVVRLEGKSG